MIPRANQLTGFYMMATLVFNELIDAHIVKFDLRFIFFHSAFGLIGLPLTFFVIRFVIILRKSKTLTLFAINQGCYFTKYGTGCFPGNLTKFSANIFQRLLLGDHSVRKYAKFSEKLTFLTP